MNRSFLNKNWKGFPHRGNSIVASNTLCLSGTANSFARQHHITKAFVNEFKRRTNITFSKDHFGSYILDQN